MNDTTQRSILNRLAITLLIALGGWLFALLVLWAFMKVVLGLSPDLWAMIEALSTAVTAAAVASAGYLAYRELTEQAKVRYIDVFDRLFAELNSGESIAARRWVYENLPEKPEEGVALLAESSEGHTAVKSVLNSLDRVAFLTQDDWIPDDMIMPWMSSMVLKAWAKLGPYVDYEMERRHEPEYYDGVRDLGERCLRWRQARGLPTEVIWVEDAV